MVAHGHANTARKAPHAYPQHSGAPIEAYTGATQRQRHDGHYGEHMANHEVRGLLAAKSARTHRWTSSGRIHIPTRKCYLRMRQFVRDDRVEIAAADFPDPVHRASGRKSVQAGHAVYFRIA